MARLRSEDSECESVLELMPGTTYSLPCPPGPDQVWQHVRLIAASGSRQLTLPENEGGASACLVRCPSDEIESLACMLDELETGRRDKVMFEPAEPSFELTIERTREGGLAVYCWLDAGNAATGYYRWDAAGVRFYSTGQQLRSFINELRQDFAFGQAPD